MGPTESQSAGERLNEEQIDGRRKAIEERLLSEGGDEKKDHERMLASIQAKFNTLVEVSEKHTEILSERVSGSDVENLIRAFMNGNAMMQYLFKWVISPNKIEACWIDNTQNPRVIAIADESNSIYYFSLPEVTLLESSYFEDVDPKRLNDEKAVIPHSGRNYQAPYLSHLGTQALPHIVKKLSAQPPSMNLSKKRIEVVLTQALSAILEGKPIYINKKLFSELAKNADIGHQTLANETSILKILNHYLAGSPYQIEPKLN